MAFTDRVTGPQASHALESARHHVMGSCSLRGGAVAGWSCPTPRRQSFRRRSQTMTTFVLLVDEIDPRDQRHVNEGLSDPSSNSVTS